MRAFALKEFGEPGSVIDVPMTEPEAGQVRVRVAAAGVNPADIGMLKGFWRERMEHRFPLIPCADLSGTVDAVGEGVTGLKKGDAVFGVHGKPYVGGGSLAEYVVADQATIARRPSSIDGVTGGALPLAGVSALQSIDALALGRGDVVVILAAAGGIGSFATQLAKAAGASVIAVTQKANAGYVRQRGADETVDYTTEDVYEHVKTAHPEGIAALLAARGDKATVARLSELVRRGGHVSTMVGSASIEDLAGRGIAAVNVMTRMATEPLVRLAGLIESGALTPPEIKRFPLARAQDAFAAMEGGHVRGKLVVTP